MILEINNDYKVTKKQVANWALESSENTNSNKYFAVLSFTRVPIYAKFHALISKILQLEGYTPLIITQSGNSIAFRFYKLFGIKNILLWKNFEEEYVNIEELKRISAELYPKKLTVENLVKVQFNGVDIGKHVLSMVCRTRLEGQLNFDDEEVIELFKDFWEKAIRSVLATGQLLKMYPIKKMLVRDSGYIPNGGIFETALNAEVDCIVHEFGLKKGTWVFKRHDKNNLGEYHLSLSDASWEKIKKETWTEKHEKALEQEFQDRYQPKSLTDTRRLQHGKKLKSPEEVIEQLGLDPKKKTAVIFSHIAWDAAFFFGTCIFGDFEKWLFETVKYVSKKCPDVNWIIKLHPYNAFKLQRESKSEESEMRLLRSLFPLPDHVKIMRATTDINTQSLFPLIDYVLTVNGTVGMEFPCFGIPSIVAGTGRYDHRGFTIDTHTVEEYFSVLDKIQTITKLDKESQELAKKHYLALITLRQTSLEDVIPMELKRFHEAQSELHNNIHFIPNSIEEFKATKSVRQLSDWLVNSEDYDILVN